ncbi:MAG: endonuclease III domain-containing protein [Acidobacteria bacterium]|nr:endonuclease III domain-containing protein [Acidobacteriota bacterium]
MGCARTSSRSRAPLRNFYRALLQHFGPQRWWPAQTPFEVIVGAILTQSTAWNNVEKAITNLKNAGALTLRAMDALEEAELAELVRPSGYYRQKAKKLKAFLRYLRVRHGGSLRRMFAVETGQLRRELLSIHGVGPETADSILLYAGGHPVFVVDAYTRRILQRHALIPPSASYLDIQRLLGRQIPADRAVYNEFHALLVAAGKRHCLRAAPQCTGCPLDRFPHQITMRRNRRSG